MFIAKNCFVVVAFFRSRTSRYARFKNAPSALLFIRSESLPPNPNEGFGIIQRLKKFLTEKQNDCKEREARDRRKIASPSDIVYEIRGRLKISRMNLQAHLKKSEFV